MSGSIPVSTTARATEEKAALDLVIAELTKLLKARYPEAAGFVISSGVRYIQSLNLYEASASGTPISAEEKAAMPELSPPEFMPKAEAIQQLVEVIGQPLAKSGFSYLQKKRVFYREASGQRQYIYVLMSKSSFSLYTQIFLPELDDFYSSFENDPREFRERPVTLANFTDLLELGVPLPGGLPAAARPFELYKKVILKMVTKTVLPWFDGRNSLTKVKNDLESSPDNIYKHENLLAIYFLLGDKSGLTKYLNSPPTDFFKQPRRSRKNIIEFYKSMELRYPEFFTPLRN